MYVADYGNSRVLVLNRKSGEVLYQFGTRSATPGNFQGVHFIAVDSKGNLYTAEVLPGNRAQRFTFTGLSSTPPPNALQLPAPAASAAAQAPPEPPSAMVNPYRMLESWPHFGGIVSGAAIGIIPDGKGGTWLHHRSEPPIIHFDAAATSSSGSATGCSCRRTASARIATAISGRATADRSPTTRARPAAAFRCSSSARKAKCC